MEVITSIQGLKIGPTAVVVESELPIWEIPFSGRLRTLRKIVYSIRLPENAGPVECARCDKRFHAAGPTGHANEWPICDDCLLACEEELGMVLALAAATRAYGSLRFGSAREHWEALEKIGSFAHTYEQFAMSRSGPARVFRPDFDL